MAATEDEGDIEMGMRVGALYDALVDAGANKEMAAKASEDVAQFDRKFYALAKSMTGMKYDLTYIKYVVSLILAAIIAQWVKTNFFS